MLKFLFPMNSYKPNNAQEEIALKELLNIDQHISIIYTESENVENSLIFQLILCHNQDASEIVYLVKNSLLKMPALGRNMPKPNPIFLRNVQIKYCENVSDLTDFFAEIHKVNSNPSFIVIQNLVDFLQEIPEESFQSKASKLIILIKDTAKYLAKKSINCQLRLLITINTSICLPQTESIIKQFFKTYWFINEVVQLEREEIENNLPVNSNIEPLSTYLAIRPAVHLKELLISEKEKCSTGDDNSIITNNLIDNQKINDLIKLYNNGENGKTGKLFLMKFKNDRSLFLSYKNGLIFTMTEKEFFLNFVCTQQ